MHLININKLVVLSSDNLGAQEFSCGTHPSTTWLHVDSEQKSDYFVKKERERGSLSTHFIVWCLIFFYCMQF